MKKYYATWLRPTCLYFAMVMFLTISLSNVSCKKTNQLAGNSTDSSSTGKLKTDGADGNYSYITLFDGGTDYHSFRIPSIVRTDSCLIAICEGRNDNNFDYGNINTVCRRSYDNGATWKPLQAIAGPGNFTDGNPTAVVDKTNNTVFVFMLHSDPTHYTQADGHTYLAFGPGDRHVEFVKSSDNGRHWTAPLDVTSTTQPGGTTFDFIGPGVGVQTIHDPLHPNRLVIPAYGRNIYSDNHGANWTFVVCNTGAYQTTESTIVEKLNGKFYRNDRAPTYRDPFRVVDSGTIGGFHTVWPTDYTLPDPHSEGSLVRYNDPKPNRIMFLNSADTGTRTAMTLRISYNEGKTWTAGRLLPANNVSPGKQGGYSSMVKTGDAAIGALVEYNEDASSKAASLTSHRSIRFIKFNLPWMIYPNSEPLGY
jgi:sialidase-1